MICFFAGQMLGQSAVTTLTVQANAQTKVYGEDDPAFTFAFKGFTNGDTASAISGEPAIAAPQRIQNLWQFTETPASPIYGLWQFQADGTFQMWNGIRLSHLTSGGNFYSSVSSSIAALSSPAVYPGMQYLLSFYAVSNIGGGQLYWHRYLQDSGVEGWGPTALGLEPRRIVFACAGTASGTLDCGSDPALPLGSTAGSESFYWLFLGDNNAFGADEPGTDSPQSAPADLHAGGFQMEPALSEKRGVLAMGDSLTQYDCSSTDSVGCTSWTAVASSQLNVPFYNRGIGGQRCDQILARWSTDATPILSANAAYAVISCGTNDLSQGLGAAQIEQSILAMTGRATADGAIPVVVTIGPFASCAENSTAESTRQSVNAWIRAVFSLVLDFDRVNADPDNQQQQNPAYLGDGTHLNLAGRIAEGMYVAQSLAGNTQGFPSIWAFQSPTAYQPILGLNVSNGMDFSADSQREVGDYVILPSAGTLSSSKYKFFFASALLKVTPAPLQVTASNKTMAFGDTLPALDGTLSGALPADNISATFSTRATGSSPPGTYAIMAALVDPKNRLANYAVTENPGTLTIVSPSPQAPMIRNLSPGYASAGGAGLTLIVNGSGFSEDAVVVWAGKAVATQFISNTSLSAQISASSIANSGTAAIAVQRAGTPGSISNELQFEIDSAAGPGYAPSFDTVSVAISPGSAAIYPVVFPAAATGISASCLNLPAGATCSYSSGAVTIATSSGTLAGNYQIVVVFTETVPGAASALAAFPIFLTPFAIGRRRRGRRRLLLPALMVIAMITVAGVLCGCASAGVAATSFAPSPQSRQVTSSGTVTLSVQ